MQKSPEIGWGVAQRFEFIEWRCYWDGKLNRGDLEREFNISTPQASIDLRNYREAAPGNIEYNATEKAFVATQNFSPRFLRLSPERYLLQLHSIETGALEKQETWFSLLPPVDIVPQIGRGPEAFTLRGILRSIRSKGQMRINYQSLTNTRVRTIVPHTLAHDGFRWHVRAWCPERAEHRDYVLGRILSIEELKQSPIEPPDDIAWHSYFTLKLCAHPALDVEQQRAVEREFRLENGERTISLNLALAYYFIRRHNLDLRNNEIPPERAQLFVKNFDEYELFRSDVLKEAKTQAEQWRQEHVRS